MGPHNVKHGEYGATNLEVKESSVSCPFFKEGYFGICVASDTVRVPGISEMENFCFKASYKSCPSFDAASHLCE